MKPIIFFLLGLAMIGCSRQSSNYSGSSPNNDTGAGQQNIVVRASPETNANGGVGAATAHHSTINDSGGDLTNTSAKPQHPPLR